MDDLIRRQAAIDAVEITPFDDYGDYMRARELIEQLPSAQPDWLPDMLFVDTKTGAGLGKIHRGEGLEPLQKKAHSTDKED